MKRGRRKGGSKEKVFGCDLMEHLTATSQEIPQVLRSCSIFIEEHGIVDGIYRLSGVSSNTQKLRSEFDSEGSPDLSKDVYLQDIHCVSSLCKAYFRELPNPLLTYQLYENFAEAVAVQLEDERLVKIRDVLKELPQPHFRTLEFLMRHLVRMATYSNETNMHARNLAIVWAPNLLRSKDIESTGFNGTAAFMEVRVQSIVVEFILTHVSQLFPESDPETGPTSERRKSLPSPSILSNQDDAFFRALPLQFSGNLSPGDGPPKMTPYHAIIDGTDKRKGSLKGRKWKSIFNLGGRLHDPRKKKYAPKEKEKTSLRPAKSMDSLSPGHYTQEDSRQASPQLSPLAMPPAPPEGGPAGPGGVSSGYAVTYRRTGGASVSVVSGGGVSQGAYRSLDPGAAGVNAEKSQPPAQATPSRAERRAGMHISGPFSVTVPLHITSQLAMKVLKGRRAEEEQSGQVQSEEEEPKKDKLEKAEEMDTELDAAKVQTDSLNDKKQNNMDIMTKKYKGEERELEEARLEEGEESGDQCLNEGGMTNENQHATDRYPVTEDTDGEDYMVMKGGVIQCPKEEEILHLPAEEEQYPDQELPLDFQDTFGFLDLMDMPTSNQLNEFSVEPPAFEMDEYEEEDKQSLSQSDPHLENSLFNLPAHISRPISNKSYSLPYKSSPFQPALSFSSEEDCYSGPSDNEGSSDLDKDEYEDMFMKSLPADTHFQGLNWTNPKTTFDSDSNEESHSKNQSECSGHAVPEDSQDSLLTSQSPDTEVIVSNADEEDLSQLLTDTELYLNIEKKQTNEERSAKNNGEDKSGFEDLGDVKELIQEEIKKMESTDSKDETLSHKDNQFREDENHEDIYFGPDPPTIMAEPSDYSGTIESSSTNNPVINEEPGSSDDQKENTDSSFDVAETETTIDVPGSELQTIQNESETGELLAKADVIQHTDTQELRDGNEPEGAVTSDRREVSEEGEEERNVKETEEKMIITEAGTEREHSEGDGDDEALTNEVDVDRSAGTESDGVPPKKQLCFEDKTEDVDFEKRKEDGDGGEEEKQQVEEEAETLEECHFEGVAELNEGNAPEQLGEEDDRLSEDGEEQPSELEESVRKDKQKNPSASDDTREEPLRPPRMTDGESRRDADLGLGVGRSVIISKHKIYQIKAVPVVPPKPQHSKITAFRQQFQQRDTERQQKSVQPTCPERQHTDNAQLPKRDAESEENGNAEIRDMMQNHDSHSTEEEKGTGTDRETSLEENKTGQVRKQLKDTKSSHSLEVEVKEEEEEEEEEEDARDEPKQRRGTWDGGSLRKGGQAELDKEAKRTSAISICFDEAVARATGKRYREKECTEKDRLVELQWEKKEQKEGLNKRKKEQEEKND